MTDQITNLDGMTPEEIAKATVAGQLDVLMSGDTDAIAMAKADALIAEREAAEKPGQVDQGARGGPSPDKWDEARLATASAEEIARATREGKLADLL